MSKRVSLRSPVGAWVLVGLLLVGRLASAGVDPPLTEAVKSGDQSTVSALVQRGVDVNAAAPDGATALHWAAHRDDLVSAELLITAGASANATNDYGVSPLSLAAENGSAAMADLLAAAGADVNAQLPSGETVLMTASRTGNASVLTTLLQNGADPNAAENTKGQTALMWALAEGHLEAALTLIDHGADISLASKSGFTPLMWASRMGARDAVDMLLDKGADINAIATGEPDMGAQAVTQGSTPLLVATVLGHIDLAKHLLERGANPNEDAAGHTPLHYAAGRWDGVDAFFYENPRPAQWQVLRGVPEDRKIELMEALLAHGADPNAIMKQEPPRYGFSLIQLSSRGQTRGATPFFIAAMSADVDVMRFLAANGADPLIPAANGATALMMASGMGWMENEVRLYGEDYLPAAKLCLELGLDPNVAASSGQTALHSTISGGFNEVIELLVEAGADVNAEARGGQTALDQALGYFAAGGLHVREDTAAVLRSLGATERDQREAAGGGQQ